MTSEADRYQQMIDHEVVKALGAIPVLLPILEKVGLREIVGAAVPSFNDVDNGTVALILCLNRLLAPQPLYKVENWLADSSLPEYLGVEAGKLHDDRLGRFLDELAPHLEEIWQGLCLRALVHYQVDLSVILYDLTSFYFEGDYTDNADVTYGYSRDHRPDTKQRVVALNVSGQEGVPLLYSLLAGNTADSTTPQANLLRLRSFLDHLPEPPRWPLLVCDRALVSEEMLVRSFGQGVHLLGPLDDRLEAVRTQLRQFSAEELRQHPLSYRPQRAKPTDPVPYYGVLHPQSFEAEIDEQTVSVPGQVLVVLSESKERLDREHRQAELKKLEEGLQGISSKLNQRQYKRREYVLQQLDHLQRGNKAKRLLDVILAGEEGALELHWAVNEEKLAQARALDGKYLLATTKRVGADEMLQGSKLRDRVEKRISLFKGPLRVRPIYVQSETRISGLVFLTLVALLVFSILELELRRAQQPQTGRAVLEGFENLRAVCLLFRDGSALWRVGEVSPYQANIIAVLGFPPPQTYLNLGC